MTSHSGGLQGSLTDRAKYRIFETREEYKATFGVEPPPYDETKFVKNWFIPKEELVGPLAPFSGQQLCMVPDVLACTTDGTPRLNAQGKPFVEPVVMPASEVSTVNIMENRSAEMDPTKMKPDPKVIGVWPAPINPPGPDEEWVVTMFGVSIKKKGEIAPPPSSGGSVDQSSVLAAIAELKRGQDNLAAKFDLFLASQR